MGPNFGVLGTNSPVELMQQVQDNKSKQAGAKLCQAQLSLG